MAYDPQKARQAQRRVVRLRRRVRRLRQQQNKPQGYNPLAPLTGKNLKRERQAAERLQFGPVAQELKTDLANSQQTQADRAKYYDDYLAKLRETNARVAETNRQNVEATEARVDQAFREDSASVHARDAAASEQAANLGRAPVVTSEGHQAVSAARSQGNQAAARTRDRAASDEKYLGLREANAALAKAEDAVRGAAKTEAVRAKQRELAKQRGEFRVDFRRKAREDEREWAAIMKEFGLKERELDIEAKNSRKDRRLEQQKLNTQKIVARLYSSANRAQARAQVRVARLQLKKGKIDQHQFNTIKNIYEGLPGGGPNAKPNGPGSGPGGSLLPWEKDKISDALYTLKKHKATPGGCMKMLQGTSINRRLARIACKRYEKNYGVDLPDDLPAYPSPND